jgi:hypothetical protein
VIGKCFTEDEFSHGASTSRSAMSDDHQTGPTVRAPHLHGRWARRASAKPVSAAQPRLDGAPPCTRGTWRRRPRPDGPAPTSGCCPDRWPCTSRTPPTRPGTGPSAGCTGGSGSTGAGACRCRWPRWANCGTTRGGHLRRTVRGGHARAGHREAPGLPGSADG